MKVDQVWTCYRFLLVDFFSTKNDHGRQNAESGSPGAESLHRAAGLGAAMSRGIGVANPGTERLEHRVTGMVKRWNPGLFVEQ